MYNTIDRFKKTTLGVIILLAWPTVVEQMLQTIVQYIDTAMVGRLGTHATAAVGVTATVTWLVNSPMSAMGIGFLALISKAVGAGDMERARKTGAQAVTVALLLGLLLGALSMGASGWLPKILGAEESLWEDAGTYFFIICTPMVFRTLIALGGCVLRASKDTKTPMRVNLMMNLLNIVLNFLLIYESNVYTIAGLTIPVWGAGLGVKGAAIASALSFTAGGIGMLTALYRSRQISPRGYSLKLTRDVMGPCWKISFPMLLERVFTCLGYVVFAALVTGLGTLQLAAHTIAITAEEIFYIPGYGMQAAAATLTGNAYGAGDKTGMKKVSRMLIGLIFVVMSVSGAILFVLAEQMMRLFIQDPEAIRIGTVVLRMVAVSEPLYGISIILDGILEGVGDTKHPFLYSTGCMWGVRILFTWIGVTFFARGLYYVWGCMIANNVMKAALLLRHYVWGKWNPLEQADERK